MTGQAPLPESLGTWLAIGMLIYAARGATRAWFTNRKRR